MSIEDRLAERWEVTAISLKPWPACRSTHGGIEMALDLAEEGVRADAIKHVDLEVSRIMFDLVGEPFAPEPEPRVAAQFSLAFTVALAFTHSRVALDDFRAERVLADQAVRDVAARITVRCHDHDAVFQQQMMRFGAHRSRTADSDLQLRFSKADATAFPVRRGARPQRG